jgi:hypothetical protein
MLPAAREDLGKQIDRGIVEDVPIRKVKATSGEMCS